MKNKKHLAANSTFSYIDDALSINKCFFHSYVDSIYPSESEIKDTTHSASYLDIQLKNTSKVTLLLHFMITVMTVKFPYLCSIKPSSPVYGVFVSHLIR